MKKEYMLYIRNKGDAKKALSPAEHLAFIKQCEVYIGELKANDNLIAAQPIVREGVMISKNGDGWNTVSIDLNQEVQVGYYHLKADSLEEAIELAKRNPEFAFVASATIEVRPIKMKEEQTGLYILKTVNKNNATKKAPGFRGLSTNICGDACRNGNGDVLPPRGDGTSDVEQLPCGVAGRLYGL